MKVAISIILSLCMLPASLLGEDTVSKNMENGTEVIIDNKSNGHLNAGAMCDIFKSYLDSSQAEMEVEEKPFETYDMYTNCYVNIREGATTDFNIIDTLLPNIPVKITGIEGEWSQVVWNETINGYIKSEFLSESETPVSELNRWSIDLTEEEIDLLARIVYLEAGIDTIYGKEAVVESIFNRMVCSPYYQGDLYSVLSRRGQYITWQNRDNAMPGEEEYQAIHNVLYGATCILESDYVYFSTRPVNGHDFIKIGKHWFGRE